ncbi:MAG: glycoside hydrolase family 99-like domain-containing protein [Clostridium sp.]|nr:glycoside hydrolase family 99-like domain-containing protein [Clostridium sp.]
MKKFAMYLPQFHEIPENNDWWGEGFTEWSNVKSAKPLYYGHIQPKYPKNYNYYNLLDKSIVEWQTKLANEYGIDGFVYYHYYFSGKLIMEKPVENLLKWQDVHQKFFFCWANHTWLKGKTRDRKVLIEQTYGDESDWKQHMDYLIRFFKDDRYEKRNNKPVFMLFKSDITNKKEMLDYFDLRCKQEGFDGICIIETYHESMERKKLEKFKETLVSQSEIVYCREPSVSTGIYYTKHLFSRILHKLMRERELPVLKSKVARINGNKLYNYMLKKDYQKHMPLDVAHGLFFEWDNTPRHGNHGYIILPPDKDLFDKYMGIIKNDEYVFINAWNEWAEGMMLEPTEQNGYRYLDWMKELTNQET